MPDVLTELLAAMDHVSDSHAFCGASYISYDETIVTITRVFAAHPHLRDDSGPVICPDIRGVRCMACVPYEDLWTSPKVKYDGCLRLDSDTSGKKQRAPIDEPCPCVKEET